MKPQPINGVTKRGENGGGKRGGTTAHLLGEFFGNFDTTGGSTPSSILSLYPMNIPRIFSSDNYLMKIILKKELHAPV